MAQRIFFIFRKTSPIAILWVFALSGSAMQIHDDFYIFVAWAFTWIGLQIASLMWAFREYA